MNFAESNRTYARPWVRFYDKETPKDLEYPEKTLYGVFCDTVASYPDTVAIDYMNEKITYRQLSVLVMQCAGALKAMQIGRGDRVTLCLPNIPQAVVAFYAVMAVGALANMIHPLSAGPEIEYYLNVSKSKCIFILDAFFHKLSGLRCPALQFSVAAGAADCLSLPMRLGFRFTKGRHIQKVRQSDAVLSWSRFLRQCKKPAEDGRIEAESGRYSDPAVILYSGGTTGAQKGILLSHLNFNALAAQTIAHGAPTFAAGDTMLAVLPMFHGFGLGVCIHTCIYKGATIILVPQFHADSFAQLVIKKKPTFMAGVPTLYEALLRKNRLDKADFSKCKGIFSGGDMLPHDVKMRFDQLLKEKNGKVTLREGFGLTECVTASALTPMHVYRKGSVGIPYPDTFYKVVEPGTFREAAPMEDGELCIHGPSVMIGYLDNQEETDRVLKLHPDGRIWLHTGDLGYMDADGFIYFKLRIKRMIKCSGYSIYPSQVEAVLNAHEAVAMSCVIGVPDDYKMQKIKAYIVLKNAYKPSEELKKSIFAYCRDHLAAFSQPKEIEFRLSLPTTKVGKIAYTVLEQEAAAAKR